MAESHARYDGLAEWYDATRQSWYDDVVIELLGPGAGRCLDLGCGTGSALPVLRRAGWWPVGLDISADQLRLARRRGPAVLRGSAERLPFGSAVFAAVTAIWVSTDLDDFAGAMREVVRVLRPGGRFVFFGVHPCFNGPAVHNGPDGTRVVHPIYRDARWHVDSPWWGRDGIRHRVGGMRQLPLAELFDGLLAAGLRIERVVEPGEEPLPVALAIAARRDRDSGQVGR